MTILLRFAALLLCLLPLPPAQAADSVRWPVTWKTGDHWTYETESLNQEVDDGKSRTMRSTDLTEIRVIEADRQGSAQTWTTRNSRIEAVEGDRRTTDLIAPMLDQFDAHIVVFELDADGRYRRIRNLEDTAVKVRKIMMPLTGTSIEELAEDLDPSLSAAERELAVGLLQQKLDMMMAQFFTLEAVETMTGSSIRTLTAFAGTTLDVGKRYRDTKSLESPLYGRPMPAKREYVIALDKENPALARIQWTHTLDTSGDAKALWHLVAELTNGGQEDEVKQEGRPLDLDLREEGFLLFNRESGVIEMMQTAVFSRYKSLREVVRSRMRLQGSKHTWPREEAPKP